MSEKTILVLKLVALIAQWKRHNRAKTVATRNVRQDPRLISFEDGLITQGNDCAEDLRLLIVEARK